MATEVGFIGLGIMGTPMALNLIKAGYSVTAYNRTASKAEPVKQAGGKIVATPAEAVAKAEFVVSVVSDSAAMEEVVCGKGGGLETLRSGAVWIDSSTISPVVSVKLAGLMKEKGAGLLDAPMTGSKHGAEQGELLFMLGGEQETLDKATPVLEVMGKKFIHLGGNGKGLGKGGSGIKKIGIRARREIELLVGTKVHLDLWVKIEPKWAKRPQRLKSLGYT